MGVEVHVGARSTGGGQNYMNSQPRRDPDGGVRCRRLQMVMAFLLDQHTGL